MYSSSFDEISELSIPVERTTDIDSHSYFTYCVRATRRNELAEYLLKNSVYTTLRYHPLHLNPLFKSTHESLINSERLNETALSLPLHPRLSNKDVDYIISLVKDFYAARL